MGLISGILIILIALWPNLFGVAGKWVLLVVGIILALHALICNCENCCCGNCEECEMPEKPAKKAKKR